MSSGCGRLPEVFAETGNFYSVRYVRCFDGDTCTFTVPTLPPPFTTMNYRLVGVDAPERRGRCAQEESLAEQARLFVNDRLRHAQTIDLIDVQPPSVYGRPSAEVVIDGVYALSRQLLDAGLAVPSDGKRTHNWCEQKG